MIEFIISTIYHNKHIGRPLALGVLLLVRSSVRGSGIWQSWIGKRADRGSFLFIRWGTRAGGRWLADGELTDWWIC